MHLTNYSINKNSSKFEQNEGDGEEGNKRSIQWFLEWLGRERGEEKVKNMWKKVQGRNYEFSFKQKFNLTY